MIIAKELMSAPARFLFTSDKLARALELFEAKQFRTLPILDGAGKILGILSESALLRCLIVAKNRQTTDIPLAEFIGHLDPFSLVREGDPIDKVVGSMVKAPNNRVLVTDDQQKLVGIVSPKDVIFYLIAEPGSESLQKKVEHLEDELELLRAQHAQLLSAKKSLEEFENILQGSLFLCHSLSPQGKIRFANRRLHEILGYPEGALIGKGLEDLYPEHLHAIARAGLQGIEKSGKQEIVYSALKTAHGESIKVEMTSIALKDSAGKFSGTATVSRIIDTEVMLKLLSGAFRSE